MAGRLKGKSDFLFFGIDFEIVNDCMSTQIHESALKLRAIASDLRYNCTRFGISYFYREIGIAEVLSEMREDRIVLVLLFEIRLLYRLKLPLRLRQRNSYASEKRQAKKRSDDVFLAPQSARLAENLRSALEIVAVLEILRQLI